MVASVIAGCSGEAAPQSKADFIVKADEICSSLITEQRRALKEIGDDYSGSADDLADAAEDYRDVIATRLERIRDLGQPGDPPDSYTATLDDYVAHLDSVVTSDPASGAVDPQPVQRILAEERPRLVREAKAYGMSDCQKLDSKPLPLQEQPLGGAAPTR